LLPKDEEDVAGRASVRVMANVVNTVKYLAKDVSRMPLTVTSGGLKEKMKEKGR
jgi:hypothetical protein